MNTAPDALSSLPSHERLWQDTKEVDVAPERVKSGLDEGFFSSLTQMYGMSAQV